MKKNIFIKSLTVIIFICSLAFSLIGCTPAGGGVPPTETGGYISLDSEVITLEKRESYKINATLYDVEGDLVWTSSDTTVVSVNDGEILALKVGQAEIKASIGNVSASCYVKVEDNNQNLVLSTNLSNEQNVVVSDEKNVSVSVFYNNKVIEDAQIDYEILGGTDIISFENSTIKALKTGSVQLVIKATWQDLSFNKIINVNVVPNMVARLSDDSLITLKTIGAENETSFDFNVLVYENNKRLAPQEYSISFGEYDNKIINIVDNKVLAVGKGSQVISAVITSTETGNSIDVELPVNVVLINQDKTSSIQLKKLAWDDASYTLNLSQVFKDVDAEKLQGCAINSIVDVTNNEIEIPYQSGNIDVDYIEQSQILGDRVWRIECEKYSYNVAIYVEKINTTALVASMAGTYKPVANGTFTFQSWEIIIITEDGTINAYYNGYHTIKVDPVNEVYGTFKDGANSNICDGYYVKDGENFNLFIHSVNNSYRHTVQFVKASVTPIDENAIYNKLAGTYSDGDKTTITLTANDVSGTYKSANAGAAKVASGQVENYQISGNAYDIIPTSSTTGIIIFVSADGAYKEPYKATYVIDGDNVTLTLNYAGEKVMTKK